MICHNQKCFHYFFYYWAFPPSLWPLMGFVKLKTFWRWKSKYFLRELCGIKSTSFCIKRNIIFVWSLPCLVIGYTSIAHGKICVHNMLNYFFQAPLRWEVLSCSFQTQMEVCHVKNYLDPLNLQRWKWQESESTLSKSLNVYSLAYLPYPFACCVGVLFLYWPKWTMVCD